MPPLAAGSMAADILHPARYLQKVADASCSETAIVIVITYANRQASIIRRHILPVHAARLPGTPIVTVAPGLMGIRRLGKFPDPCPV